MIFWVSWQLFETLWQLTTKVTSYKYMLYLSISRSKMFFIMFMNFVSSFELDAHGDWYICPYSSGLFGGAVLRAVKGRTCRAAISASPTAKTSWKYIFFLFKLCNLPLLMSNWGIIVKYASKYYSVKPKLTSPVTTTYIFGNYTLIFLN